MPEMMAMGSAGLKSLTGGAGKVFQGGIGMGMGIGMGIGCRRRRVAQASRNCTTRLHQRTGLL